MDEPIPVEQQDIARSRIAWIITPGGAYRNGLANLVTRMRAVGSDVSLEQVIAWARGEAVPTQRQYQDVLGAITSAEYWERA